VWSILAGVIWLGAAKLPKVRRRALSYPTPFLSAKAATAGPGNPKTSAWVRRRTGRIILRLFAKSDLVFRFFFLVSWLAFIIRCVSFGSRSWKYFSPTSVTVVSVCCQP
jgi:hypothetical protein